MSKLLKMCYYWSILYVYLMAHDIRGSILCHRYSDEIIFLHLIFLRLYSFERDKRLQCGVAFPNHVDLAN